MGSNNINLLLPNGQFGTRNQGGKEAASARYIFTALSPVARHLFNEEDDHVLHFLEEEGQSIEPAHYLPILPLCLVNGAQGIGTGWSTTLPPYNPRAIIANLKRMMGGEEPVAMVPWYKGWAGTVERADPTRYSLTGCFSRDVDEEGHETELAITELPAGRWTRDYKTWLEAGLCGGEAKAGEKKKPEDLVEELREHHAENRVHFRLSVPRLESFVTDEAVIKKFGLRTTLSVANLVLFDFEGKIRRYEDEREILKEWYGHRLTLYEDRRAFLLARLGREHALLANRVKFIQGVIAGGLTINKVKRQPLLRSLQAFGLAKMSALQAMLDPWKDLGPGLKGKAAAAAADAEAGEDAGPDEENKAGAEADLGEGDVPPKEYEYLLGMPMWSVTEERVEALIEEMRKKRQARDDLEGLDARALWVRDLDAFEEALAKHEAQEEADRLAVQPKKPEGPRKGGRKGARGAAAKGGAPARKPAGKGAGQVKTAAQGAATGQAKLGFGSGTKPRSPKPKAPAEMSLKERMAARFGGDIPMAQAASMHKASDNLTAAQREALARGPGHKRAAEETTIFKELQQMADAAGDDSDLDLDLDDAKARGATAQRQASNGGPADLTKRRQYAALQEVQPNASQSRPAQKAPAQARRRRAVVDDESEGESSSGWSEEEESALASEESDLDEYEL